MIFLPKVTLKVLQRPQKFEESWKSGKYPKIQGNCQSQSDLGPNYPKVIIDIFAEVPLKAPNKSWKSGKDLEIWVKF